MGSMKSIVDKNFGKFPKAFWAKFWAYLTVAYIVFFRENYLSYGIMTLSPVVGPVINYTVLYGDTLHQPG